MVLDKNITKYITVNDKMIIAGQSSGGIWYIKELPADNTNELDELMGECNKLCNKYNNKSKTEKTIKKSELPDKKIKNP